MTKSIFVITYLLFSGYTALSAESTTPRAIAMPAAVRTAPVVAGCDEVDLRSELGPVRSQGNIGWCYANTAADLISFKFRHQWKRTQASALFIALTYNYSQSSSDPGNYIFNEGGDLRLAMSYAGEVGFSCPRELDEIFVKGGMNIQIKQKLHLAETLKTLFDNRLKSEADLKKYTDYVKQLRDQKSILAHISDPALEFALKQNLNLAVQAIAQSVCRPYQLPMGQLKNMIRRYHNVPTDFYDDVEGKWFRNQTADLLKYLNRQLDQKNNVVGIDYKMKMISPDTSDNGLHASVIVGRKVINGQCQYLVRNSWGPDCNYTYAGKTYSHYNKNVTCLPGEGHVWVKLSDLKANLEALAYLLP